MKLPATLLQKNSYVSYIYLNTFLDITCHSIYDKATIAETVTASRMFNFFILLYLFYLFRLLSDTDLVPLNWYIFHLV